MLRSLTTGVATAAVVIAGVSTLATAPSTANAATAADSSTTILNVGFHGTVDGTTYTPGNGETVDGSLRLDSGKEAIAGGAVSLAGGTDGLTFTPSTSLGAGGITTSVSVEALAESATDGNKGVDTLLSLGGSAHYRFKSGLTGASEVGMNGPGPSYPAVSDAARTPSSSRLDHIRLVYTYVGPTKSELSTYVNGCQVGQSLVNSAPAEAAANAIGFGNEVHSGATNRGFVGRLGGLAVTTFTGAVPDAVLPDAPEQSTGAIKPGNTIPISACDSPQRILEKAANVVPTANQLAWQKEELTGFVHFGPDTFTDSELGTGTEPVTTFAPTDVDTDGWAKSFKDAGFKKVILVAKHHDGFVLFPSRYTNYSVKFDSAWKNGHGDLVRDFVDSMHKYGLKVGLYLSPADLHEAQPGGTYGDGSVPHDVTIPTLVPGDDRTADVESGKLPSFHLKLDDYNAYYLNEMYELLTQYGRIDEVWLDGANPTTRPEPYDWRAWYKVIDTLAPHAVAFNGQGVRWIGNESAEARTTEWSPLPFSGDPATTRYNHEQDVEWADDLGGRDKLTNAANYVSWFPGECDARIEPGWFWHAGDAPKSMTTLRSMYRTSEGRNCQFLLDVPPDTTGHFDTDDTARLQQFGAWVKDAYADDPAVGSAVTASSAAGAARKVADGNPDTYWQPDGTTGDVSLTFAKPTTVSEIVLQEGISIGQRVESYAVDARVDGAWQQVATGTTIGYKRLLQLATPVTATGVRLRITGARLQPAIATVGVSSYVPVITTRSPHYLFSQKYDDGPSYKRVTRQISVPATGGSLSFWTSYDTEPNWDYLFVEAHTPGQDDWTTLPDANGHTSTKPGDSCANGWVSLHPQMAHYQTYDSASASCTSTGTTGSWNAATGSSGGWQQWKVDLSKWAGQTVEVSISYASDWGSNGAGVWLDDATLPDGTTTGWEDGLDGWSVPGAPAGEPANPNDFIPVDAKQVPPPD